MSAASLAPVALRARADLVVARQTFGREAYWLVKDPVAMRYFHLRNEEHALLEMFDGRTTLVEIRRRFEARFAPWRLSGEQLFALAGRLHELGLLVSDAPGQGEQLLARRQRQQRRGSFGRLANLLAIRLPGVNPAPLLERLAPACRWIFSRVFFLVAAALVLAAIVLVATRLTLVERRLPDFEAFFTWQNIAWLAATMAAVKVVHELGHAVTCRHYGGECREIGVLLLVFTPCLYCNVSDAWTFVNKWQRIAVSAAGIAAELLLAAAATFLWWFSVPGLFNTLCLNVMVVCSLSTLVFNGNPLLRYDGYYALADLVEVPNLAAQSSSLLWRSLARWTLGVDLPPDRWLPPGRRGLLMLYAAAAAVYRAVVLLAVLWLIYRVLAARGMEVVAQGLFLLTLSGAVILPGIAAAGWLLRPSRRPPIRAGRAAVSVCVLLALVAAVFLVPLPCHVAGPAVLEPLDAQRVYAAVAGRLAYAAAPGQHVEAGQVVARLVNLDLRKETAELAGQVRRQERQLANLRLRQADAESDAQINPAQAALDDSRQRLAERQRDEARLVLRAPIAGMVLPPPRLAAPRAADSSAAGDLASWQGTPLDEPNRGCFLEEGTLVCLIGSPSSMEAWVLVDQADVNLVAQGEPVRLRWELAPDRVMRGEVEDVAESELKFVPPELVHGSDLPVRVDEQGIARPQTVVYQVRVQLDESADDLRLAGRGRAKIDIAPRPLAWRLGRFLRQTFH